MTKDALWKLYVKKNPMMESENVCMTARGIKRLFDLTWEKAHDAGFENGKAWEKMQERPTPPSSDPLNVFKGIFDK